MLDVGTESTYVSNELGTESSLPSLWSLSTDDLLPLEDAI